MLFLELLTLLGAKIGSEWGLRKEKEDWRIICTREKAASRLSPRREEAALWTEMAATWI